MFVGLLVQLTQDGQVIRWASNIASSSVGSEGTLSLLGLLQLLAGLLALVELGGQPLARTPAERLLDEPAGFAALAASEAFRLHLCLSLWADGDLDALHEAPPTVTVSLMDPSARVCSTTLWPRRRASIFARSTAYAWTNRSRCSARPHAPP